MSELLMSGSVGGPAGNRRLYPAANRGCRGLLMSSMPSIHTLFQDSDLFLSQAINLVHNCINLAIGSFDLALV